MVTLPGDLSPAMPRPTEPAYGYRRGHGRSTQTSDGHDMDHYADDLLAFIQS
jgi:hypothetical protein